MRVFCISWPKAGTHVLLEVAKLLLGQGSWYEEEDIKYTATGLKGLLDTVDGKCAKHGDTFALKGHIPWSLELEQGLAERNFKLLFIIRDPRDVLCSTHRWLVELRESWAVSQYLRQFRTKTQLLKVIQGLPKLFPFDQDYGIFWDKPLPERYALLTPWSQSTAHCLKFEQLIGAEGAEVQIRAINDLIKYLELGTPHNAERIASRIVNPQSRTFHTGKSGTWERFFDEEHRKLFVAGGGEQLVDRFGYRATSCSG